MKGNKKRIEKINRTTKKNERAKNVKWQEMDVCKELFSDEQISYGKSKAIFSEWKCTWDAQANIERQRANKPKSIQFLNACKCNARNGIVLNVIDKQFKNPLTGFFALRNRFRMCLNENITRQQPKSEPEIFYLHRVSQQHKITNEMIRANDYKQYNIEFSCFTFH